MFVRGASQCQREDVIRMCATLVTFACCCVRVRLAGSEQKAGGLEPRAGLLFLPLANAPVHLEQVWEKHCALIAKRHRSTPVEPVATQARARVVAAMVLFVRDWLEAATPVPKNLRRRSRQTPSRVHSDIQPSQRTTPQRQFRRHRRADSRARSPTRPRPRCRPPPAVLPVTHVVELYRCEPNFCNLSTILSTVFIYHRCLCSQ